MHTLCIQDYEIVNVKINLGHTRDWYLICIYRPPGAKINPFCEQLEVNVSDLWQKPLVEILVIGDINIDLFENYKNIKMYKNCLRRLDLKILLV